MAGRGSWGDLETELPCTLLAVRAAQLRVRRPHTADLCPGPQATQGLANTQQVVKSWVASFAGNFVGSMIIVGLMGLTGLTAQHNAAAAVAVQKTSITFMEVRSCASQRCMEALMTCECVHGSRWRWSWQWSQACCHQRGLRQL